MSDHGTEDRMLDGCTCRECRQWAQRRRAALLDEIAGLDNYLARGCSSDVPHSRECPNTIWHEHGPRCAASCSCWEMSRAQL